jgi:hypothetical protein
LAGARVVAAHAMHFSSQLTDYLVMKMPIESKKHEKHFSELKGKAIAQDLEGWETTMAEICPRKLCE